MDLGKGDMVHHSLNNVTEEAIERKYGANILSQNFSVDLKKKLINTYLCFENQFS